MSYVSEEEYTRLQAECDGMSSRPRIAESARYDLAMDSVILALPSGISIGIPVSRISELANAPKAVLAHLRLSVSGEALILNQENVHISTRGLLRDMVSLIPVEIITAEFAAIGGSRRSAAKKAASAANGRLGGRPRKVLDIS